MEYVENWEKPFLREEEKLKKVLLLFNRRGGSSVLKHLAIFSYTNLQTPGWTGNIPGRKISVSKGQVTETGVGGAHGQPGEQFH